MYVKKLCNFASFFVYPLFCCGISIAIKFNLDGWFATNRQYLERECDRYYGFNQHLWSNSSFTFIPHLWRPCAWRERMAVTEAWEPCAAMTWRWVQKLSKITKGKWLRSFRVGFLILGIILILEKSISNI